MFTYFVIWNKSSGTNKNLSWTHIKAQVLSSLQYQQRQKSLGFDDETFKCWIHLTLLSKFSHCRHVKTQRREPLSLWGCIWSPEIEGQYKELENWNRSIKSTNFIQFSPPLLSSVAAQKPNWIKPLPAFLPPGLSCDFAARSDYVASTAEDSTK